MTKSEILNKILPPIIYELKKKILTKKVNPKWNRIKSGLLRGNYIFVPNKNIAFQSMIRGDYDNFFWDYINKINLDLSGETVLDIGAHIGFHSLSFAKLVGKKGKVLSFEPNPYNLERFKINVAKNIELVESIEINECALGEYEGNISFNFSSNVDNMTSSGGYIEGVTTSYDEFVYRKAKFIKSTVAIKTIDSLVEHKEINRIKLMKIDVEGAEGSVLKGGIKVIKKFKPTLMIEIHSVLAMLEVCNLLIPLGYNIEILQIDRSSRCFIGATIENI